MSLFYISFWNIKSQKKAIFFKMAFSDILPV